MLKLLLKKGGEAPWPSSYVYFILYNTFILKILPNTFLQMDILSLFESCHKLILFYFGFFIFFKFKKLKENKKNIEGKEVKTKQGKYWREGSED